MKAFLYGLLGFAVLLVAAVLVGPRLIDWTAHKDVIADRVAAATGRDVAITGTVEVSTLPRPTITVRGIELGDLGRADALRLELAWAPLLQGRLRLRRVELVRPTIAVRPGTSARVRLRQPGGVLDGLSVGALTVTDGTIRYTGPAAGRTRVVRDVNARVTADTLHGPARATGSFTAAGVPLEVEARIGEIPADGTTTYRLRLDQPGTATSASLTGSLRVAGKRVVRATGELSVEGDDLTAALRRAGLAADRRLPAYLGRTFTLGADLTVDTKGLRAKSLTLGLGERELSGEATLTFGDPERVDVRLDTQRLDLDAAPGAGGDRPFLPVTTADWRRLAAMTGVTGEVALDIGGVVHRGDVIRQVRVRAAFTNPGIEIQRARAFFPGSGEVRVTGTSRVRDGEPVFTGSARIGASNLRAALRWLDAVPERVAADRLRRLKLKSDVTIAPGRVTLTGLTGHLDTTDLRGGVAIALRERPGFGVRLDVPTLRLGGYLKPLTARPMSAVAQFLDRFDANLDLHADTLVHRGTRARDVDLKGALSDGKLTLETARIGRIAGSRVKVGGTIAALASGSPVMDLHVNAKIAEPERFAAATGLDGYLPPAAGALTATGTVAGPTESLSVDLALEGLGGRIDARGLVRPRRQPPRFQGTVQLRHDALTKLFKRYPAAPPLPSRLKNLNLAGEATVTPARATLHMLVGRLGGMEVSGTMSAQLPPSPRFSATLHTPRLPLGGLVAGAWRAGDGTLSTAWLDGYTANLDLTAGAVALGGGPTVKDGRLTVTIDNRALSLSRLQGNLGTGRIMASATLEPGDTPRARVKGDVQGVEAGGLLSAAGFPPFLTGTLDARMRLQAQGRTGTALRSALNGSASLSGTASLGRAAVSALEGKTGGREALQALANAEGEVTAEIAVRDGVARAETARLATDSTSLELHGTADLAAWTADAKLTLADEGRDEPVLTARLTGPLGAPELAVATPPAARPEEPAIERLAPALPTPQPSRPEAPAAPRPERPAVSLDRDQQASSTSAPTPARPAATLPQPPPEKPAVPAPAEAPTPQKPATGGDGSADAIIEDVLKEYGQ